MMDEYKTYDPALMSLKKLNNYGRNAGSTLRENRELLIRMIKNAGSITRKKLADGSGLQRATITIIVNELLERNIVETDGMTDGDHGRRVMRLKLVNRYCAVAVRLNPAYFSVAVYDMRMECLYSSKTFHNYADDLPTTCDMVAAEIKKAAGVIEGKQMLGIAVGVGGGSFFITNNRYQYYDKENGRCFDIGREIAMRTESLVVVNRMSNFTAYNIWQKLARMDIGTLVTINVSYTVECGMVVNGEILNGEHGAGGLIGRLFIDTEDGPCQLNRRVSARAQMERAHALMPEYPESVLVDLGEQMNIRDLIHAYLEGDELAQRVYNECAVDCGRAVAVLVRLLDPGIVFLGDEIPLSEQFFLNVGKAAATLLDCKAESATEDGAIAISITGKYGTFMLRGPDAVRGTRNDPSLKGAAGYMIDAAIGMGVFFENV